MQPVKPATESVASRYAATLGAQVFRMLLSLVTAAIVPRVLGPATYGDYNFLLSTSAAIRGFLDSGTQQAFFTFSCQTRSSGSLTRLYAWMLCGQFAIALMIIWVAALTGEISLLLRGQHLDQIVLVTVLDWILFLALSLQQLGDSKGLTVYPQLAAAVISFLTLVALLIMRLNGALNFYTFVWLNLSAAVLTCIALAYRLLVRYRALLWDRTLEFRGYVRRWWRFTRPLILLQYYFPVVTYLGVYLIQRWYGSAELGYYALALRLSSFAMVFTTSGVSIFWREIAHESAVAQDLRHTSRTYERFSTRFFFLALALSCGLSAGSAIIVDVVAGARFNAAANVLAVMAFYPISQTINQLTVASMKATERTGSYAVWSVLLSVPDVLLTYVLLAPTTAPMPGFHLGATGMAIKTALYGVLTAQVFDWLNCRFFNIRYGATLINKAAAAIVVGTVAVALMGIGAPWLRRMGMSGVTALGTSSCIYAVAVTLIVLLRPQLAGITRGQLLHSMRLPGWR